MTFVKMETVNSSETFIHKYQNAWRHVPEYQNVTTAMSEHNIPFAIIVTLPRHITTSYLTLNLLTTTIVAPPSNASKWQMGFNSAFKGLSSILISLSSPISEFLKFFFFLSCIKILSLCISQRCSHPATRPTNPILLYLATPKQRFEIPFLPHTKHFRGNNEIVMA